MIPRSKILLYGGLALCLLGFCGDWAFRNFYELPLNDLTAKQAELEKKIETRRHDLTRAKKTARQLAHWEGQSLPADVDVARSLYRAWLIQQVGQAGLIAPNVDSGSPVNHRGQFQSLPFSVRGKATLEQLTRFLFAFYRSNHLHQIQSLAITPYANSNQLDVSLSIEALILPGAERKDSLADGVNDAWSAKRLDDYRVIVRRNLFSVGGSLDAAAQTYLSGITSVNGRAQAWFDLRSENRTVKLTVGDRLDIGDFAGTVTGIDRFDVTLDSEGQRWLLSIGENLDQAFAVPALETTSASR